MLETFFGAGVVLPPSTAFLILFLLCALLVRDFAAFWIHRMQHRIDFLWEFHKVHHAPPSLIPPTSLRLHPIDQFVGMVAEVPLLAILVGFHAWLTHENLSQLILFSIGLYALINMITFSPLRHSHIDLRLGFLERFLFSPAHHRLHHSMEPQHRDKNFAAIFPFWDRMFQSFKEPPPLGEYRLGLPADESERYATVARCYLEPFRRIRDRLRLAIAVHQGHRDRVG
jgi:sterol desaturase/sphingolipid hydroxylase (fatty acid hydroxylase superfamily)